MNLSFSNLCAQAYYQAKISPNAQYVANATANRIVIRRSSMDLSIVNVFECLKPVDYIQWSPNSECILAANYESSRIEVHSIIDPKWTATIKDLAFPFASVQWTVDSKNIITVSQMNLRVSIWNLSKKELRYINYVKYEDKAIETSPDGKYVAVVHKRNGKDTLSVYHSSSFILLEQFELNMVDVENIRWSPDSSCIAVWDNCLYNNLIVYRTDGYICTTYEGYEHGLGIKSVCWSQNGKFLAIGYYDQTIHLLYTLSWKLITILSHPSVLNNTTTNIALYEEVGLSKTQVPTLDTLVAYRQITKRPFSIPSIRSDLNQPNPRVGIGLCQFSTDGLFLASRNDNMPNVLWIWDIKTLCCRYAIIFRHTIKQIIWNPVSEHLLAVHCGDENIHFIKPLIEGGIDLIPSTINTNDFLVKKAKWSPNGKTLLLLDQQLYCLAEIRI